MEHCSEGLLRSLIITAAEEEEEKKKQLERIISHECLYLQSPESASQLDKILLSWPWILHLFCSCVQQEEQGSLSGAVLSLIATYVNFKEKRILLFHTDTNTVYYG